MLEQLNIEALMFRARLGVLDRYDALVLHRLTVPREPKYLDVSFEVSDERMEQRIKEEQAYAARRAANQKARAEMLRKMMQGGQMQMPNGFGRTTTSTSSGGYTGNWSFR